MNYLNRLNFKRILLNIVFIGFVLFTSLDNSSKHIPWYIVFLYNILLFIPALVNNFILLKSFRNHKKFIKYLFQLIFLFVGSVIIIGLYLNWIYSKFENDNLSDYTSFAMTSTAPESLQAYQHYFDVFPGILFVLIILAIGYVLQEYLQKIKTDQNIKSEQYIAELNLLKSQISPHFLFNVLNSLYALSLKSSNKTPDVILKLSDILRYSLYESQQKKLLISNEVEVLKTYIEIEKIRIPNNVSVNFNYEIVHEYIKIAPMLLLPILENAFKHGVDSMIDSSFVNVDLFCDDKILIFTCENNFKEQAKKTIGGIGLENVRKRLQLIYPLVHLFEIKRNNDIYKVSIEIKF